MHLVVMGATAEGKKELVALSDGFRESEPDRPIVGRKIRNHFPPDAMALINIAGQRRLYWDAVKIAL